MSFQVHQDTILLGNDIQRKSATIPKAAAYTSWNATHNNKELKSF